MKVKICGIVHPADAIDAAIAGADFIGMILSSGYKRSVTIPRAKEIAAAAKNAGAIPVGVFVDATVDQIMSCCKDLSVNTVQLHGASRNHAKCLLERSIEIFFVIEFNDTALLNPLPKNSYYVFDSSQPGQGKPFDWTSFIPPKNADWFLAGGLNPKNVNHAISLLQPHGVDVSSGVECISNLRKDKDLIKQFIKETL